MVFSVYKMQHNYINDLNWIALISIDELLLCNSFNLPDVRVSFIIGHIKLSSEKIIITV